MRRLCFLAFALALLGSATAASADVDWNAHAADQTIQVVTQDADGAARERTIWLLVLDGQGYIRTGSATVWGENVLRDPNLTLRIGGADHALRAERVTDAALLERVRLAFREKYGFGDTLATLIRGEPLVFRVVPR